ncbi:MAG: creatininase family protein [Planctomycetota bacterium]
MTLSRALELISAQASRLSEAFTAPNERLHPLYLGTALVLAVGVSIERQRAAGKPFTLRGLVRWLFPRELWLHPSAKADYLFFALNRLLYPLLVLPFVLGVEGVREAASAALDATAPGLRLSRVPAGLGLDLAFSVFVIVAMDFGLFLAHYLAHRVPLLWEFHKVHHSAEVMTPITVHRMHPLDDAFTLSVGAMAMGLGQGLFLHLFPATGGALAVKNLHLLIFVFYVVGYDLRHSHVSIGFGPLDRVFVSPAMHQVHHSLDPAHHDKNMGFLFSVWDALFGTRVLPEPGTALRFGLDGVEEAEFQSLGALYLLPFKKAVTRWKDMPAMTRPTRLLLIATLLLAAALSARQLQARSRSQPVRLADLTWTEVRDRVAAGTLTAIVPTGGTEQNGPHVSLGKHNTIVAWTADEIARRHGHALVAPVIAYVPEGSIEPPSLHMRKAGTLSVSEETFEALLEQTARSLKAHGFQWICFLGDSGGNQEGQERVAARLDREWAPHGVRVVSLSDYYLRNGQVGWLHSVGETDDDIGTHAGIRDTSELMALEPSAIRWGERAKNGGSDFETSGVDGDPGRASAARGRVMLELKVRAGLKQLLEVQQGPPEQWERKTGAGEKTGAAEKTGAGEKTKALPQG